MHVVEEATDRESFEYSKYDLKEIRALNPVQAALVDQANEDTDSDDQDDDEGEELRKKLRSAGLKEAAGPTKEDDSSSYESASSSGSDGSSSSEDAETQVYAKDAPSEISLI